MSKKQHQQTTKAGIIATFYGPRDEIQPLTHELGVTLGLVIQAFPDVQYLSDPDQGKFLRYFDPPAAHDTRVVLLALSEEGQAHQAWERLYQKLCQKLDDDAILERFAEQDALWGYNLIYHAALVEGSTPNEHTLAKLLPLARRPNSEPRKRAEWVAHTEVAGTQLWLMDIPNGEGTQAATVYVALSPLDKENDMITKVLYGQSALLLMPDLIAHKSYYQIRQLTDQIRDRYEKQLEGLRDNIPPLLGLRLLDPAQTNSRQQARPNLDTLSNTYARLLMATSGFDELRIALAQQLENYTWWEHELGSGDLAPYYKQQMRTTYRELELLTDKGQRILDGARTTIEIVQAKQHQKQEQRENLIAALIAILGTALACSQIVDPTAAAALIDLYQNGSALSPESYHRLVGLFVQFIPLLPILTIAGYWAYRKSKQ